MALASTVVANSNTTIISGTANKVRAVTCIFFCCFMVTKNTNIAYMMFITPITKKEGKF